MKATSKTVKCLSAAFVTTMSTSLWAGQDLQWTGATDAKWSSANNWKISGTTTPATFADGDDVTIDDTSSSSTISFDALVNPGKVIINRSKDLTINQVDVTEGSQYGFGASTGSIEKRGTGTLTVTQRSEWQGKEKTNLNTCDISIYGGTIVTGKRANYNALGDSKTPFWVKIYDGGCLWLRHMMTTGIYTDNWDSDHTGNMNVYVGTGGVFKAFVDNSDQCGSGANPIGWLWLDGGTLHTGGGAANGLGALQIRRGIKFSGATPYVFAADSNYYVGGNQNQNISLRPHVDVRSTNKLIEFDVADITGGEGADVTFNQQITRYTTYPTQVEGVGIRKTGVGHLKFGANMVQGSCGIEGDIRVEKGILELAAANTFNKDPEHELYVGTNVELRITAGNAINNNGTPNGFGASTVRVDHGTLTLANPTTSSADWLSYNYLGSLVLDHATFDWSGCKTGKAGYGLLHFGSLLEIVNDKPVLWDSQGVSEAGVSFRMLYQGYTADTTSYAWVLNRYGDPAKNCGTEVRVAKTDGSKPWDFCLNLPIKSTRDQSAGDLRGGFVKTGLGTFCLNYANSCFNGNVIVREGTLMLSSNNIDRTSANDCAQSLLGASSNPRVANLISADPSRQVRVETNGTLFVNCRNALPQYKTFENPVFLIDFFVYGGTIKFADSGFIPFPNVTVAGGTFDYGNGAEGWGLFKVVDTFKVTGEDAFELPAKEGKSGQMLAVNGYPATTFDVDDVTGDSTADLTVGLNIGRINGPSSDYLTDSRLVGFRKTGTGTMRYTAPLAADRGNGLVAANELDGDVSVEAGEFRLDGNLSKSQTITVSSGAFLSGSGKARNITLAEGAGLRVSDGQKALTIVGNCTLPQSGVIELTAENPSKLVGARVLRVNGTFTRPTDLSQWTLKVNGEITPSLRVVLTDHGLRIGPGRGLVVVIR